MKSKVLGIDLDGTIYDWHSVVFDQLQRDYNIPFTYYDFWKDAWRKPQYIKLLENIVKDISLYGKAMVRPAIRKILTELDMYYDIVYITQRPASAELTTRLWLKKSELPNYSNVYIVPNKTNAIRETDCAFYVEDRAEFAHQIKLLTHVILLAQPWNMGLRDGLDVIFSIDELPEMLYKLDKDLIE